VHRSFNV